MTVHFAIGWWAIPTIITIVVWLWALLTPARPSTGDYSFPDVLPLVRAGVAMIISLFVWLIWALV